MVRSLYVLIIYLAILGIGTGAPFLFTLGYVWVDIFRPQDISWTLLPNMPVAALMGGAAIGTYLAFDRQSPPRVTAITVVTIVFALWVTATTFQAIAPKPAWWKWDWAFKAIMFSVFIPYVIRSRNQIEAFLQVYLFSLAANIIPFGLKTILTGGGGYGHSLGLIGGNTFLGEQDTLAASAVLAIPLMIYLIEHTRIIPRNRLTMFGYAGLALLSVATIIGTHERAALLALGVVGAGVWLKGKRKVLLAVLLAFVGIGIVVTAPAAWWERMSTISETTKEGSIMVRLRVWEWTLNMVSERPVGGGFEAYRKDRIVLPDADGKERVEVGRAFHSTFFEVLGEHGWFGLALFLSLLGLSFKTLRRLARQTRDIAHLKWVHDFASALQVSLLAMLTCGAFVSIGFLPFFYYVFGLTQCLSEYVRRVELVSAAKVPAGNEALALARP